MDAMWLVEKLGEAVVAAGKKVAAAAEKVAAAGAQLGERVTGVDMSDPSKSIVEWSNELYEKTGMGPKLKQAKDWCAAARLRAYCISQQRATDAFRFVKNAATFKERASQIPIEIKLEKWSSGR